MNVFKNILKALTGAAQVSRVTSPVQPADVASSSSSSSPSDIPDAAFTAALAQVVRRQIRENPTIELGPSVLEQDGAPVITVSVSLSVGEYTNVALSLTEALRELPFKRVRDYRGNGTPVWGMLETLGDELSYPLGVTAHLLAGGVTDFDAVLALGHASQSWHSEGNALKLSVRASDTAAAKQWLSTQRTIANRDFERLRNQVVELYYNDGDLYPRVIPAPDADLDDVVVTREVRKDLVGNVLDHVRAKDLLQTAALGSNRGVLLWGPPGTGKTSLVRGLVHELAGKATVLLPSTYLVSDNLAAVYLEAARLSPCVVVLEDIDVVASRRGRSNSDLASFLNALDGVVSDPNALIVTVATTNDPNGIDDAAKRPGRIDRFIEVGLPDETTRGKILALYLDRLTERGIAHCISDSSVRDLARSSDGASGALLREVVRRALLLASAEQDVSAVEVREVHLTEASAEIGYRVTPTSGHYL